MNVASMVVKIGLEELNNAQLRRLLRWEGPILFNGNISERNFDGTKEY